ncbi:MAG: sigma-54-dependent transcriptional regulator [Geminicoccaceae bacterium]
MNADILVVDDEIAIRETVSAILEDEGYGVKTAANSSEALKILGQRPVSLVLLDVWLEGSELDGIDLLATIRERDNDVPVVVFSGHGTIETAVKAIRQGAYDFLEKPFKTDRLLVVMDRAMEAQRLKRENRELRLRIGHSDVLIGETPPMIQLRAAIQRVAPTNSRVLINGPAGSGKEVVARLIHAASKRADGPFVAINAATMAPERVEVELFGQEFRDANGRAQLQIGTFERAHGGTLLLDEVSDMPLETQGKLLRVLQEQHFVRAEGGRRIEVDVRVLASTHRNLEQEIAEGRFREDLYYRLNVVPLTVPPLIARRDDIPLLVEHFIDMAASSGGLAPRSMSHEAMAILQTLEWPGNVRELKNAIERIMIMAPGDAETPIGPGDLPPELLNSASRDLDPTSGELITLPLKQAREAFERAYLRAQLERFGGNISRTAGFVGMERSALHRKLRSLELTTSD